MPGAYVQGAFESIPGNETNTPVLSTKKVFFPLLGLGYNLNPDPLSRDDEVRNSIEPLPDIAALFDPELSYSSRLYPDLAGFFFSLAFGKPTTTVGNGVITDPDAVAIPAACFRHVWTSAGVHAATTDPLTADLEGGYKDNSVFFKAKGVACSGLSLAITDKAAELSADLPTLFLDRVADPALSPTYETAAIHPFLRRFTSIKTWLASTAAATDLNFKWDVPVEKFRSMGIESAYPDVMSKGEGIPMLTGSISQRDIDADDWDAMKAQTGFAAKVKLSNNIVIAGGYKHTLWIEASNLQYTGESLDELGNKRRHGAAFDFKATSAGATAWTVTLVNATTNYN